MSKLTLFENDDVISMIRAECAQAGSQYQWATRHKLSPAYISDVLHGKRAPGQSLLKILGLQKTVRYEAVASGGKK